MFANSLWLVSLLARADAGSSPLFVRREVFTMGCIDVEGSWTIEVDCTKFTDCYNDVEFTNTNQKLHTKGNKYC